MARYWRTWKVRSAIELFAISIVCLFWLSNKLYGLTNDLLLRLISFQSIIALAISFISGVVIAIIQRSSRAGGIALSGVFFGAMISGTVGLAIGIVVAETMDRVFPGSTDPDLPNLGAAFACVAVWFFGQAIGAIWGGADWLALCTSNRSPRENQERR